MEKGFFYHPIIIESITISLYWNGQIAEALTSPDSLIQKWTASFGCLYSLSRSYLEKSLPKFERKHGIPQSGELDCVIFIMHLSYMCEMASYSQMCAKWRCKFPQKVITAVMQNANAMDPSKMHLSYFRILSRLKIKVSIRNT